jgi:hypothetical protein
MESILTNEDKLVLRKTAYYLRSFGMSFGSVELHSENDVGSFDFSDISWDEIDTFSNNYKIKIPEILFPIIKKLLNSTNDNFDYNNEEVFWEGVELVIDAVKLKITLSHHYSYYSTNEVESISFDSEEDQRLIDTFGKDVIELGGQIPQNGILTLKYDGGGDSGYLESSFEEGSAVPNDIENWCYNKLEENFGGWETNEGSSGYFYFDFDNKELTLQHTDNVEISAENSLFEESFSN